MASGGYERIFIYVLTSFQIWNLFVFIFTRKDHSNSMIKTVSASWQTQYNLQFTLYLVIADSREEIGCVWTKTCPREPDRTRSFTKVDWSRPDKITSFRFIFPIESISGSITVVKQGRSKIIICSLEKWTTGELSDMFLLRIFFEWTSDIFDSSGFLGTISL